MPQRSHSTEELAELLDVDRATVLNWCKLGLPHQKPKSKKEGNHYDVGEALAWMRSKNITGKIGRPAEADGDELRSAKIKKEKAIVEKYERQNAVEAGKLIDAAEEQRRDVRKIMFVRNRLCGLGAAISPQLDGLDGPKRQAVIDGAIEEILQDLSSA